MIRRPWILVIGLSLTLVLAVVGAIVFREQTPSVGNVCLGFGRCTNPAYPGHRAHALLGEALWAAAGIVAVTSLWLGLRWPDRLRIVPQ